MHVVNGCDQWVWLMAVSIGGGFTGKPHHEVAIPIPLVYIHSYDWKSAVEHDGGV